MGDQYADLLTRPHLDALRAQTLAPRDALALGALQSLILARGEGYDASNDRDYLSREAYRLADAMLRARGEPRC